MSDETIRENQNATVREEPDSAVTRREGQTAAGMGNTGMGSTFQGYRIVRQLPTKGSEADIFIVEKDGTQYILKQYRYGINPKRDILLAIKALSESHPHEFVRLFDVDFDPASGRWYEIQEYIASGSLQTLMADRSLLTDVQQATFFNDVTRELTEALHALHQNNLLHLDLKPSNILLRSVHPLNLVLIDFGIATSLASDMSKKFTQVRGTPMYQSPESYSGGMGRPADWWGLGMILLEIAAGAHPFKGLSNNIIAYAISTEPVPVPEDLDAGRKELLQGLLTRDPEKRWSYEQVVRWLSGERSILQHFETAPVAQAQPAGNAGLKPLKFMDRQYQSLAELAAAFLKDEQSWEKGKGFLIRGYVRQWLEKNEEFDAIMDIDEVLSGVEDPDEKVFRFAQRFGGDMPFAFGGHLITLENLLLFAGKVLQRQPVTAMEQKIADSIANGVLLSYLDFYKQQGQSSEQVRDLELVLKTASGKSREQIAKILDTFTHPENYAPVLKSDMTIQEIAQKVEAQEREKRESQERLEWERREQDTINPLILSSLILQQERLEQERREQERKCFTSPSGETWTNSIGMEFVKIPAGTFWMGSGDDDEDAFDDEKPRHEVELSHSFYLGKYPVTQEQWNSVMGGNPSYLKGTKHPVERVSWDDVQAFIAKLNAKEGHGWYRLPTEAEWEYACQAGSSDRYCFGNDKKQLRAYAWYKDNSRNETHPVGQKKPNSWGLYDMYGNVWEWVQDRWGDYSSGFVRDPQGPYARLFRVLRGGCWDSDTRYCRGTTRGRRSSNNRDSSNGFRLALSLED